MGRRRGLIIAVVTLFSVAVGQTGGAAVESQVEIEILIPHRNVMQFTGSGESGSVRQTVAEEWKTTFDLSCATTGTLPPKCLTLYGGPLLDTEGRPYPPDRTGASGQPSGAGGFPQFFESPEASLRIYSPASNWELQVELLHMDAFPAHHFALFADPGAGWQCLGFHPDWNGRAGCDPGTDAARSAVPVAAVAGSSGDWKEIALRLMLRLDGNESSGSYSGVLRYTLVSF